MTIHAIKQTISHLKELILMVRYLITILATAVAPFILVSCGNKTLTSSSSSVEGISEVTDLFVAEEVPDVNCYRIPALLTAANGDLIAAIDERVPGCADLRGSRDINIAIRRSSDQGVPGRDPGATAIFPTGRPPPVRQLVLVGWRGRFSWFTIFWVLAKDRM